MKPVFKWIIGAGIVGGLTAASVPFWPSTSAYDVASAEKTLSATASAEDKAQLVARGKYLAAVADCAACHQSPDGAPYAGGLPIDTPFGVIYGTNITPDKETGIGNYTSAEFYHAVADGVRGDGKKLYPAMPYVSYHAIRQADSDAIYAYLMTQQPVNRANPALELPFPFNQRWAMAYWNLVNGKLSLPANASAEVTNGAYLTDVLGHCQECHTPRNIIGGMKMASAYQGSVLGKITAPSLTPEALAARGWTVEDIRTFLKTGMSPQGTMTLEMYPVLLHSSQYMTDDDIAAIQTYLTGDQLPVAPKQPEIAIEASVRQSGRDAYMAVCAGCHGVDGEGKPHIAPPMNTNTSAKLADPSNLIHVLLDGIAEQKLANGEVMQSMPGFKNALSNQELADLVNYMRAEWGGQPANITVKDIEKAGS